MVLHLFLVIILQVLVSYSINTLCWVYQQIFLCALGKSQVPKYGSTHIHHSGTEDCSVRNIHNSAITPKPAPMVRHGESRASGQL